MNRHKLMLRLSEEEARDLETVLLAAHQETVRALSEQAGCGYSSASIDLCRRRNRLEHLIECLNGLEALRIVPAGTSRKPVLALAA